MQLEATGSVSNVGDSLNFDLVFDNSVFQWNISNWPAVIDNPLTQTQFPFSCQLQHVLNQQWLCSNKWQRGTILLESVWSLSYLAMRGRAYSCNGGDHITHHTFMSVWMVFSVLSSNTKQRRWYSDMNSYSSKEISLPSLYTMAARWLRVLWMPSKSGMCLLIPISMRESALSTCNNKRVLSE